VTDYTSNHCAKAKACELISLGGKLGLNFKVSFLSKM